MKVCIWPSGDVVVLDSNESIEEEYHYMSDDYMEFEINNTRQLEQARENIERQVGTKMLDNVIAQIEEYLEE